MVFNDYSQYYDLFYADKDYESECDFLEALFSEGSPKPVKRILELGCGTGGHALLMAQRGYAVTGVDIAEEMLIRAQSKARKAGDSVDFVRGDLRDIRLKMQVDVVLALFAVLGYQVENLDFLAALRTARAHLDTSGRFIFDAWYGPAVLRILPETRYKEFHLQDGGRVLRIADPDIHYETNTVTVNYHVLHLKNGRCLSEVRESHHLRYFFMPEVEFFAQQAGFRVVHTCAFMEPERFPGEHDWNVTWVLEAV